MRALLVDCLGLLYRGHYALIKRPLRAPDGTVTSGLHHLLTEIFRHKDLYSPDLLGAIFDYPAPSFRKEIYEEYKANRPEMPDEIREQSRLAREVLSYLGCPVIERRGLEADDLIASLTTLLRAKAGEVLILSSDKDLLQLAGPGVTVIQPGRPGKNARLIGPDDVQEIVGVEASQIVDYMALVGDSTDNVPGARGIGKKTALSLLDRFGSLDNLLSSLDDIERPSIRAKVERNLEAIELSRRLVTLRSRPPEDLGLDALKPVDPAVDKAARLLERLGMRKLLGELPPASGSECDCLTVRTGEDLEHILNELRDETEVAVDTETTSTSPMDADPIGLSVCAGEGRAWYVPLAGEAVLPPEKVHAFLERLVEGRSLIAQNSKYDLHILRNLGVTWDRVAGDPFLADYLLRPQNRRRSLGTLARLYLGESLESYDDVVGEEKTLAELPVSDVADYCCKDASAAWRLHSLLSDSLERDPDLRRIYRELELPLVPVLLSMERRGVSLDVGSLEELESDFSGRLSDLTARASEMVGGSINLNSPSQVSTALFDTLGMDPVRKTPGGAPSSSMSVLLALRGEHEFVDLVIEHREVSKLLSTYVHRLPEFVCARTGLIHTSFNQAVTATGRLSSSDPNLQNIPIRTDRGRMIRKCFRPPREREVFVSADYSQIELRVLAHLSEDGPLSEAYRTGRDVHVLTAEAVFGASTPEHRRKAKEVNFSIVYGISPYGLSQRLGMTREEASGIIRRYFERYPEVESFFNRTVEEAEAEGETRTILGRRRDFTELSTAGGSRRKALERMAVNTTVQGSAADVMKLAMLRVHDRLRREIPRAGLVLQVHDELVASVPETLATEAAGLITEEMENAVDLDVDLEVETGVGGNWLEAQH
ncbi:DNA polymerase I [Candidatus Fermentibacteria bacterium]|nr:DNA polymerase I [Candidatus Fermentibacteria bacterium]